MKKILVPVFLMTTLISIGQSVYRKDSDLKKQNGIKQTDIYMLDKSKSTNAILFQSNLYDRNGRTIDTKSYTLDGKLDSHSKFEYPNDTIRFKISVDSTQTELKRIEQKFDLSDKKREAQKNKNRNFEYEYDSRGNATKIYRIVGNEKSLLTEKEYNQNNYLTREGAFSFRSDGTKRWKVRIYERDESDNILRITTMDESEIENVVIYVHKKYST